MDAVLIIVALIVAAVSAGTAAVALTIHRRATGPTPTDPTQTDAAAATLLQTLRADLADLQQQALERNRDQFLALAQNRLQTETARGEEQLKARQQEIEKGLQGVTTALKTMTDYVQQVDRARGESIVELTTVMKQSQEAVRDLNSTTGQLSQALRNNRARGQWGERMAEDILRAAGFIEGVNYLRNRQIEGGTSRPDFTFPLPQNRVVHMDVKFPLDNFLRVLGAESDTDRQGATKQFLTDVRARITEVTNRDYIDPAAGTLDYLLVFIPNEQIYAFIHEHDPLLLDEALRLRVVLCSPFTLFAVLAVIRQSVENFRVAERTNEILGVLGAFAQQWTRFQETMEMLGRRLESTQKAYDDLSGVRTRQLDRQIDRVEQLRRDTGVEADALPDTADDPTAIPAAFTDPD